MTDTYQSLMDALEKWDIMIARNLSNPVSNELLRTYRAHKASDVLVLEAVDETAQANNRIAKGCTYLHRGKCYRLPRGDT